MKKIVKDILNVYLIAKFFIPIIIIIILLIIGYFKFAKPVYDEHKVDGYELYETRWIDSETGKAIPKSQLNNYNFLK